VIPLPFEEIAALALGRLEGHVDPVTGIVADSRATGPGDLFVGLNTGVEHVGDAAARGAVTLVPDDQHDALARLASLVRSRSSARVVAVVGSTGKTSTKDALAALCAAVTPTIAAAASLNNEIGLPLTVCRLEPDTDVLVTEMGMRGRGQIAELCRIAQPHLVLVSAVGPEHLALVGSVEAAVAANAEAIEALPAGGIVVVPAGEPLLEEHLQRDDLDVRRFDRTEVQHERLLWRFSVDGRDVALQLPTRSRHMAENVLAALTAYHALGLPLERAHEGAARIRLSPWRGEMLELPGGGVVVNDSYNANPTSMRAALVDLDEVAAGRRRVAILGEMAELGDAAAAYHAEIAELIARLGIEAVVAVGEGARAFLDGAAGTARWVESAAAFDEVADVLQPGDAVLVKGSRAVGLEGVAGRIANLAERWSES
jgi:UDP-N-acetylmuramoyl-tripeptide--D-alanyl-D-alanine ligase